MVYKKRQLSTPQPKREHFKGESVEKIVSMYLYEWGYSWEQTLSEIMTNFEMSETEIDKAVSYLNTQPRQ